MGKYRVNKSVAVLSGNKVTVYNPSDDEFINLDDETAKTFGDDVEPVGQDQGEEQPTKDQPKQEQVPANTPDTQAATSLRTQASATPRKKA